MCCRGEGGIKPLCDWSDASNTFPKASFLMWNGAWSRRYSTVCAAVSRRRTASALRREAPHYAGSEPAVGSGTGFAGRPKVNKQETQLFRSPPQRDLKFPLSSLCHNLKLIQSGRRRHPFFGCAAGPPRSNAPDLCRTSRHSSQHRCGVT